MIGKLIKYGLVAAVGTLVVGAFVFGDDALSYLRSSTKSLRASVKDNIPIEFELRRARDLLDQVIPEMQANVRLIAQQEVEIAAATEEISIARKNIDDERGKVKKLRDTLATSQTSYTLGRATYTRDELTSELSRRFTHLKEAEMGLSAKQRLLENRQKSLVSAEKQLEQMRARKATLEAQVEALATQHRLVHAASLGTQVTINDGKLAQAERLIGQVRKQLDVAERVLAREAKFTGPIPVEAAVDEKELFLQVDEHFGDDKTPQASNR